MEFYPIVPWRCRYFRCHFAHCRRLFAATQFTFHIIIEHICTWQRHRQHAHRRATCSFLFLLSNIIGLSLERRNNSQKCNKCRILLNTKRFLCTACHIRLTMYLVLVAVGTLHPHEANIFIYMLYMLCCNVHYAYQRRMQLHRTTVPIPCFLVAILISITETTCCEHARSIQIHMRAARY